MQRTRLEFTDSASEWLVEMNIGATRRWWFHASVEIHGVIRLQVWFDSSLCAILSLLFTFPFHFVYEIKLLRYLMPQARLFPFHTHWQIALFTPLVFQFHRTNCCCRMRRESEFEKRQLGTIEKEKPFLNVIISSMREQALNITKRKYRSVDRLFWSLWQYKMGGIIIKQGHRQRYVFA